MQETQVRPLVWEDPLEKEMASHSSILAWEIPWTEESGELQTMGWQRVGHDLEAATITMFMVIFTALFTTAKTCETTCIQEQMMNKGDVECHIKSNNKILPSAATWMHGWTWRALC